MVWFFNNPAREDTVRRALGALKVLGYDKKLTVLKHDPIIPSEAAGQLGVETGAIVQALPYMIAGQPIVAFIAGDYKCKTVELPRCLNLKGAPEPMTVDEAKETTGYIPRGIAPVALTGTDIPMAIDVSLKRFETIYVPAGHPQCYIGMTVQELKRVTQGIISYAIAEPA